MNDIGTLTGQPQPITVDGETYMVHPLTVDDWGALQAWVDRQFPNPLDAVRDALAKGGFKPAQEQFMIKEALALASKPKAKLGSIEADELLVSAEGSAQVLYLTIRKGRPDFTEKDAAALAEKLAAAEIARLAQASTLDMVVSDPKSEPLNIVPPSKTSGPAASRRRRSPTRTTGGNSSTG